MCVVQSGSRKASAGGKEVEEGQELSRVKVLSVFLVTEARCKAPGGILLSLLRCAQNQMWRVRSWVGLNSVQPAGDHQYRKPLAGA